MSHTPDTLGVDVVGLVSQCMYYRLHGTILTRVVPHRTADPLSRVGNIFETDLTRATCYVDILARKP